MANLAWVSLLVLISGFRLVLSVETYQDHFQVPDGSKDDFSETFYNGDTMHIQWAGWDSRWTDQFMNGATTANLYVASWNPSVYSYERILSSSIDISVSGTYPWKIDISSDALSNTSLYGLHFISLDDIDTQDASRISSRGFFIREKVTTSSSFTGATTTTTTTPTTTSKATLSTGHGTKNISPKATTSSATSGLSTGAKAGIGVGAGLGGLAVLAGLVFLLVRRRRKPLLVSQDMTERPETYRSGPIQESGEGHPERYSYYQEPKPNTQELLTPPTELPSSPDGR